jgi:large subunit ribosomal protein L9
MSTQVILTATVESLGTEGNTVTVADGYARNYLIPKGLAMPATPGNLRRVETLRKRREEKQAAQLQEFNGLAKKLAKQSCTITTAAGADGKLFGSVTAADISKALRSEGMEVDRRKIVLEHPIRELGVYDIDVKLHPEVSAKVKVWIVAEEAAGPPAAEGPAEPAKKPQKATKKK